MLFLWRFNQIIFSLCIFNGLIWRRTCCIYVIIITDKPILVTISIKHYMTLISLHSVFYIYWTCIKWPLVLCAPGSLFPWKVTYDRFDCTFRIVSQFNHDHLFLCVSTDIYNIRTLSVNITFICTSFRNRQHSEPLASFSGLFRSEYKWIVYLTTMYVYCVYPAMSKKSENLSDLSKKGQKQASFLAFHKCCQGCPLRGPRYISISFILVCALRCT